MEDKTFRISYNKPCPLIENWINLLKKQLESSRLFVNCSGGPGDKLSGRLILGLHKNGLRSFS